MSAKWRGLYMMGGESGNVKLKNDNPACYEKIRETIASWRPYGERTPQPAEATTIINQILKRYNVEAECAVEFVGGYGIVIIRYK